MAIRGYVQSYWDGWFYYCAFLAFCTNMNIQQNLEPALFCQSNQENGYGLFPGAWGPHSIVKDTTILQTLLLNSVLRFSVPSTPTVTVLFLPTSLEGEYMGETALCHIYTWEHFWFIYCFVSTPIRQNEILRIGTDCLYFNKVHQNGSL